MDGPDTSKEASRWRIELARTLARPYAQRPGVAMVLLGGSPSRGLADAYSDLDVVVYWEAFDLHWLEAVPLKAFGLERAFFRPLGPDVHLESYRIGTLKADVGHTTLASWERWTDEVRAEGKPNPPVQKSMAGFLDAVPLHGADRHRTWCERIRPYPEALAANMVKAHLGFFQKGVLDHQGRERSDLLFFRDGLCQMLKKVLGVLAGLNRVYFCPDEPRWLAHELARMPVQPDDCWPRMIEILEGDAALAAGRVEALLDEVLDLVEARMPSVDVSRLRRGVNTRVEACEERPALPVEDASGAA